MIHVKGVVEVEATERPSEWKVAEVVSAAGQKLGDYLLLAKVRLSLMVLATGLVGFWLASGSSPSLGELAWFAVGTFLIIAGANAFNQVAERYQDRLMQRTACRPLPAGRMSVGEATAAAALMLTCGLGVLSWSTNILTVSLAALASIVYLLVYTPLKRMTHWSTFAGAVSGAIPPLMGWSAVRNDLGAPAWIVFGIIFLWQFPHTWSIASWYYEDFARAGFKVLPLVDGNGKRTRRQVIGFSFALAMVSLLPTVVGVAGTLYTVGALASGLVFVIYAVRFAFGRTRRLAGHLMAASLVYMPLILALLLLDWKSI